MLTKAPEVVEYAMKGSVALAPRQRSILPENKGKKGRAAQVQSKQGIATGGSGTNSRCAESQKAEGQYRRLLGDLFMPVKLPLPVLIRVTQDKPEDELERLLCSAIEKGHVRQCSIVEVLEATLSKAKLTGLLAELGMDGEDHHSCSKAKLARMAARNMPQADFHKYQPNHYYITSEEGRELIPDHVRPTDSSEPPFHFEELLLVDELSQPKLDFAAVHHQPGRSRMSGEKSKKSLGYYLDWEGNLDDFDGGDWTTIAFSKRTLFRGAGLPAWLEKVPSSEESIEAAEQLEWERIEKGE